MPDLDSEYEPFRQLVRELSPIKIGESDFQLVNEDRLMMLAANVYMLRAVTSMWRRMLSSDSVERIDAYGDGMLAYKVCQTISYLYSDDILDDPGFAVTLKVKNQNALDHEVFDALGNYLDLLEDTGHIGNDIRKRAMEAMYSICAKSEACRSAAQSISEGKMEVDSHHWSVELIRDLAES